MTGRVLCRPRIWHQLVAIGLAFTLPLGVASTLLAAENGQRIEFSENELRGLAYLRPLNALLVDVGTHQTLNRQVLAGKQATAELAAATARVDADLAALLHVDGRLGAHLRTTADQLDHATTVAGLMSSWRALRAAEPITTVSDAGHDTLTAQIRQLIGYVGITSNLLLDPKLDTYHVADASVVQVPELIDRIRQLGDTVDSLLAGGRITLGNRNRVAATAALLDIHADALREDLFTAFGDAADPGTDSLRAALGPLLQNAYTAVTNLRTLTMHQFVYATTITLDRVQYAQARDAATSAMSALSTALDRAENRLLTLRRAGSAQERTLGIISVLAALAIAIVLTTWLSRRITTGIGEVSRVAAQLASGDLTRRTRTRGGDEVGALAVAFNSMAERLQHMVEAQQAAQLTLSAERDFIDTVVNIAGSLVLVLDRAGRIVRFNRACEITTGYQFAEVDQQPFGALFVPAGEVSGMSRVADRPATDFPIHFEDRLVARNGSYCHIAWANAALVDEAGAVTHVIATGIDVTARRAAEERLVHQALHDPLTHLPNRVLLMDRLEVELARLGTRSAGLAVIFVDLDGFKAINDGLGHDAGDQVLIEVAGRLRQQIRPGDTIARLAGDEFVVLYTSLSPDDLAGVAKFGERLTQVVGRPIMIETNEVVVTASIGIALSTAGPTTAEELIRNADRAMYHAKARGKNRIEVYDETLREHLTTRVSVAQSLRRGLRDERFRLYFQPVVDVATGTPVAVEALLRLDDAERGLIAPDSFIEAAEETGLIVPVGAWVMTNACRQLAEWRLNRITPENLHVAVNLSVRQATRPDLIDTVTLALLEAELPPHALALELTESVLMEADAAMLRQLERIRDLGVRLGIDDFGTGYSSLTYLKRLPVSFVKIDRSFVSGLVTDQSDREIVTAVIRLGQALGLITVAEGVEDPAQLAILRDLGCDLAQGYLLGRPSPSPPASTVGPAVRQPLPEPVPSPSMSGD